MFLLRELTEQWHWQAFESTVIREYWHGTTTAAAATTTTTTTTIIIIIIIIIVA